MIVEMPLDDAEELPEPGHSITLLIQQLKKQDPDAAAQIWARFSQRLLPVARARLNRIRDCSVDDEDVLVSVFDLFFRAAREGRFARLNDRSDLWQILLLLTDHKVTQQFRRATALKRGKPENASSEAILEHVSDRTPSAEFFVAFNDELNAALQKLDNQLLRDVALLRLDGYENREIAKRLQISLSSVERKLRLIRERWENEFRGGED